MAYYQNEQKIKEEIMTQSRHLFIYGYDTLERRDLLISLENDYPIRIDEKSPMAVYLDEFSLPELDSNLLDKSKISMISSLYLDISIVYNIIRRLIEIKDLEKLGERYEIFISKANNMYLNPNYGDIEKMNELLNLLKTSRDFYIKYYEMYTLAKDNLPNIDDNPIPFIDINSFLRSVKTMLGNDSYFGVIVDSYDRMPLVSQRAVNDFVNRRCNADLSMKVACDVNEWRTYYDLSGSPVEPTHDYGIIQLDDCYSEYSKKLRKIF